MPVTARVGGANKSPAILHGHSAGSWRRLRKGWTKVNGVWRETFQDEVTVAVGSANNVLIKDHFNANDWANPLVRKRFVINGGAVLSATASWGAIAIMNGGLPASESWAGDLIIDNHGDVRGIGGAPNSGWGGNAFYANFHSRTGARSTLNNYGALRGGGGGGGRGGDGGTGYTHDYQHEGMQLNQGWIHWGSNWQTRRWEIFWGGGILTNQVINGNDLPGEWIVGGHRYYRGGYSHSANGRWEYSYISRQLVNPLTHYHAGGWGGQGGRGEGSDGANQPGQGGGGPGPNAGWGGSGNWGNNWGQAGLRGLDGGGGNAAGGNPGQEGGPAGMYLDGLSRVNFNNQGTAQGRVGN